MAEWVNACAINDVDEEDVNTTAVKKTAKGDAFIVGRWING